eukprot:3123732-Rhodomonas_salina.1
MQNVCITIILLTGAVFGGVQAAPDKGSSGNNIRNCETKDWKYYNQQEGDWGGGVDCGVSEYYSAREVTTHRGHCTLWFCSASQEACELDVCIKCMSGYYQELWKKDLDKTWASNRPAVGCTACANVVGCEGEVNCSAHNDQQCARCSHGRYLLDSSHLTKADTCPTCNTIPNCVSGRVSCTTSSDEICEACNHGYFLANENKGCRQCQ